MDKAYYEDMTVTARNRELSHTPIYGTFLNETDAESRTSGYAMSLDGAWKFMLAENPGACPAGFERCDFDDGSWLSLVVPGNWQLDERVEDLPVYTNEAYLFEPDPPKLPAYNPTGCYRREFEIPEAWLARDVRLIFDAVDSACQVWVNGEEVGYSEDSRLPAEFAVTPYLRAGKNVVAVKVFRFSTGSYLEDQDFWFMSGIQRRVRLLALSPVHLRDWRIFANLDETCRDGELDVTVYLETRALPYLKPGSRKVSSHPGYGAKLRLLDADGQLVAESGVEPFWGQSSMYGDVSERDAAMFRLPVPAPAKWSPEHPNLYKLFLHLTDETGRTLEVQYARVGFRRQEIRDRVLLLNGRRLIVRGVNRHEFSPRNGRAVTEQEMVADIRLMKELHFNAVRNSHYPGCSRWYELCDEMGLCVVDEANLETHGVAAQLSKDPAWASAYLERAVRMVLRDRNHPCVCFWSLGNESSYGPHHAAMANWVREMDPSRPVQYESGNPGPLISDLMVPMYPSFDWIDEVMADGGERRPMILCEYAYAKGNATGNFKKYWDLVHKYPSFQGGFIWDWADKALWYTCIADGRKHLGYGNDFGENFDYASIQENGTQVLNGIVGAELDLHPGAWEVKQCQAPVRFAFSDGVLTIFNDQHDTGMEELQLVWKISRNGETLSTRTVPFPVIAPGEAGRMMLAFEPPRGEGEYFLDLECRRGTFLMTWAQFPLHSARILPVLPAAEIPVWEEDECLAAGPFRWSKKDGKLSCPGYFRCPAEEIFFRAPTCNDRMLDRQGSYYCDWQRLVRPERRLLHFAWGKCSDGTVSVETVCDIGGIESRLVWRVGADGTLQWEHCVTVPASFATVPRIGLLLTLESGEELDYFGRGPHENYPDRQASATVGRYHGTVSGMLEHYLSPGECGSRGEVRELQVGGVKIAGVPFFRFSALHVSPWDLLAYRHAWELPHRPETYLTLDGFHCGVGGDTGWSRNIHDEYLLKPGVYRWGAFLRIEACPGNVPCPKKSVNYDEKRISLPTTCGMTR